jgi:hypothetical protein
MASEQSKTFSGMLSTLKDNANQLFGKASKPIFDWLKGQMPNVSDLIGDLGGILDKYGATDKGLWGVLARLGGKDFANNIFSMANSLKPLFDAITGVNWQSVGQGVTTFITAFANGGAVRGVADGLISIRDTVGPLGDALGGWGSVALVVSGTMFRLGQGVKFTVGNLNMMLGLLRGPFGKDQLALGMKQVDESVRAWVEGPFKDAGQAIYDAQGRLIGFNNTPVVNKKPTTTFPIIANHASTATGKVQAWNVTQANNKTPWTNFPTIATNIQSAVDKIKLWNMTKALPKSAKAIFGVVPSYLGGGPLNGEGGGGNIGAGLRKAYSMVGKPYIWGGMSDAGADCSGLVSMVLRAMGLNYGRLTTETIPGLLAPGPGKAVTVGWKPGHTGINVAGQWFEAKGRAYGILGPGQARSSWVRYFHPPGFKNGGYVDGPESGYTIPVTFHGKEYISPEGSGNLRLEVPIVVDGREIRREVIQVTGGQVKQSTLSQRVSFGF